MNLVELGRVTKVYGEGELRVMALDGIDLTVEAGTL
jgi:hypothetical protein